MARSSDRVRGDLVDEIIQPSSTVQHRVLGVHMQMSEVVAAGLGHVPSSTQTRAVTAFRSVTRRCPVKSHGCECDNPSPRSGKS